jgi:hypothetical protein
MKTEFGDLQAMYGAVKYTGATVLDIGADYGTTARWFLDQGAARVVMSEQKPEWLAQLHEFALTESRVLAIDPLTAENARDILTRFAPEIVKVDCEKCERFFLNVPHNILSGPRAWLIETHTRELLDAFTLLFGRIGYDVSIVQDFPEREGRCIKVILATLRERTVATPGLITGMGRSGSMWTAAALRECAGIDARHETVPFPHVGKIRHVEVNSLFAWAVGSWMAHPAIPIVHLVRDGRDVVRSACERNPGTPFARWVWEWTSKNDHMLAHVPADFRFRIEDLVGEDPERMRKLAAIFGGELDEASWREFKAQPQNAGPGTFPGWDRWTEAMTQDFWRIGGDVMERCGYERST